MISGIEPADNPRLVTVFAESVTLTDRESHAQSW